MNESIYHINTEVIQLITPDQAWHYRAVPYHNEKGAISLYVANNQSAESVQDELEILLGKKVQLDVLSEGDINQLLSTYYRKNSRSSSISKTLEINARKDFLVSLIEEAHELKSSDIHIEPLEKKCRIRFRIDGLLVERYIVEKDEYPELVNRIKIKSNLDIAEKRLPQDGRIRHDAGLIQFDLRVSVLPTMHGEKVVMRILGTDATSITIESLGMDHDALNVYRKAIQKSNGIVLISGPTGSGKTTTLYATLNELNNKEKNIVTIEDPIEYTLEGINQVQLKESIGLTFPKALSTFLRQDPDIIMVGEIRDRETAEMAIRASLTGHLVLSTIHTNSALGTIHRLVDMGIPAFLIGDTLNVSVAQRLIRLLCPSCKVKKPAELNDLPENISSRFSESYAPQGCEHCYYTGYKGRIGVFEVLSNNSEMKQWIHSSHDEKAAMTKKQTTMAEQCISLVESGKTSLQEVYPILISQT